MFFTGTGLTFIEMVTLYRSADYPAIISIMFFIAFSLFNGLLFIEAIENSDKKYKGE